jgi:hypothetical protein
MRSPGGFVWRAEAQPERAAAITRPTMVVGLTALAFAAGIVASRLWLPPPAPVPDRIVVSAPAPGPAAQVAVSGVPSPKGASGPAAAAAPAAPKTIEPAAAPASPAGPPVPASAPAGAVAAPGPVPSGTVQEAPPQPKLKLLNPDWQDATRAATKQEKVENRPPTQDSPKQLSDKATGGASRREHRRAEADQPEYRYFSPPPPTRPAPGGYAAMRDYMLGR